MTAAFQNTSIRSRLLVLFAVAVAARFMTFDNPIVHVDEEYYFAVARAMWSGAVPFIDLWDRKPIGLFIVYMPAAWLSGSAGIIAYQAMALVSVIATAWIVVRLADRAGWRKGAMYSGIAYILWLNLLSGAGGQSPVFYNLPMACAALLVATPAFGWRDRFRGYAAMALIGIALQIKYSVVFEGVFIGLWLMWIDWRRTQRPMATVLYSVVLVLIALFPTAIALAAYIHIGAGQEFIFANFLAIFSRKSNPPGEMLGNLSTLVLILSPLVAMGMSAWYKHRKSPSDTRLFLVAWMMASIFGVLIFGTWYDHYGLPVVLPASICAAAFLGAGTWRGRATPAILLVAAFAGQIKVVGDRLSRGSPEEFAQLVEAVGRGPGCLYIYSGHTMLQALTERCWVTAYVFPSFLIRPRENGAMGVDQVTEVRHILAQRPEVIVVSPFYQGEHLMVRSMVMNEIARSYQETAVIRQGYSLVRVYKLKSAINAPRTVVALKPGPDRRPAGR